MKSWLNKKMIKAKIVIFNALNSERGDTNFISILIILGIVILLAGVFIGFKEDIIGKVKEIIESFVIK